MNIGLALAGPAVGADEQFVVVLATTTASVRDGKPLIARAVAVNENPEGQLILPPVEIGDPGIACWLVEIWAGMPGLWLHDSLRGIESSVHYSHPLVRSISSRDRQGAIASLNALGSFVELRAEGEARFLASRCGSYPAAQPAHLVFRLGAWLTFQALVTDGDPPVETAAGRP